jgi:AraC-like DNA-binding protein
MHWRQEMPMSGQNNLEKAGNPASAHKVWTLGGTGIELQSGMNVSSYELPVHFHDDYQFMLVGSGAREITFRGDRHVFGGEYLTVVNPGESHSTRCHGEHGSTFKTMRLPVSTWATDISNPTSISAGPLFPFEVENKYVSSVFRRLHEVVESEGKTLHSEELLAEFAEALLNSCRLRRRSSSPRGVERRLNLVRSYIADNFAKSISLDELTSLAGMSKYHLLRCFADAFGMPPHAFQIRVRLNKAKAMLSTGIPIKQAAAMTGFTDPSHFGRHFVRLVGFMPRNYQLAIDIRHQQRQ